MISVIIPTYNPSIKRLNQTLDGLKQQSLNSRYWESIIIDNNSNNGFNKNLNLSELSNAKIIFKPKQGLTFARLKGIAEAQNDIIIMVDDDNILDSHYLEKIKYIY